VSAVLHLLDAPLVRKLARYSAASLAGVVVHQTLFFIGHQVIDWDVVPANLVAVGISSIPAYLVNRYWVWKKSDRNSFAREVVPFWTMAFLGLLLSTLFVHLADEHTDSTLFVQAASLAGFGVLWVAKFIILDRVLFAVADDDDEPVAVLDAP
jgi:putative flippase GtrA